MVLVFVVVALAGLALCLAGSVLLRRRHRWIAGRQNITATVAAATDQALILRLPTGEAVTVPVRPELAAQWRRQLAHGPGPFEEPELADPAGWNEIQASHDPDGSPPVVLSQALDDARNMPLVLVTLGVLTTVAAPLALSVPILLAVLGVITAVVAAVLVVGLIRTARR